MSYVDYLNLRLAEHYTCLWIQSQDYESLKSGEKRGDFVADSKRVLFVGIVLYMHDNKPVALVSWNLKNLLTKNNLQAWDAIKMFFNLINCNKNQVPNKV